MNTLIKLLQLRRALSDDLRKDSMRLYNEISQEYILKNDFKQLGKLILLIERQPYYIKREMKIPVIESMETAISYLEKDKDYAMLAIYLLLTFRVSNEYTSITENEQALCKMLSEIPKHFLLVDFTPYSWAVRNSGIADIFSNELFAVIGLELKQYKYLYEHYATTNNRSAQAYLLTLIAKAEQDTTTAEERLLKVMHDYSDLDVACEAALEYYNMHFIREKEESNIDDQLAHKNCHAEKCYHFLKDALNKWGKWRGAYKIEMLIDEICSTLVTECSDLKQVWYTHKPKQICLECRNVKKLEVIVYETPLTGWDYLRISNCDDDVSNLKRVLDKSKVIQQINDTGSDIPKYLFERKDFYFNELPIGIYIIEIRINGVHSEYIKQHVTGLLTIGNAHTDYNSFFAVLNAETGFPVKDASIRCAKEYRRGERGGKKYTETKCDVNGIAILKYNGHDVYGYSPNDKAGYCDDFDSYVFWGHNKESHGVKILTDRSIYRPGQCIHIAVVAYSKTDDQRYLTCKRIIKIQICNAKRERIHTQLISADEYGVGKLDFTIPEDIPTGTLKIYADKDYINVSIEEYKRPTFEVSLNPYEKAYKAGDVIQVSGCAQSYVGLPIDGATVKYKVMRRIAHWWWYYSRYWDIEVDNYQRRGDEVYSGESHTDVNGLFYLDIPLMMPSKQNKYSYYDFVIIADVVDKTGETHSSELVLPLSEKEYMFRCMMPKQMEMHSLSSYRVVLTNSLGEEIVADVRVQVDERESISIAANQDINIQSLPIGRHTIRVWYKEEMIENEFIVVDNNASIPAISTEDWMYCSSERFSKDKPLNIQVGTSSPNTYFLFSIQNDRGTIESGYAVAENGMLNRSFLYTDEYRYGIRVCYAWVKDGVCHHAEFSILPPEEKMELQLHWETFRNRLEPGEHETWRLRITQNGEPADANMIATLYDKSLEQLVTHSWNYFAPHINFAIPETQWNTPYLFLNSIYYIEHERSYHKIGKGRGRIAEDDMLYPPCGAAPDSDECCSEACLHYDDRNSLEEEITEEGEKSIFPRTNFSETSFFIPNLRTNDNGEICIEFDLPDTLTTWRFRGVAHTKEMHYGFLTDEVIAQKQLMLQPNIPRFLRVGDETVLSAKITNLSGDTISTKVQIELRDTLSDEIVYTEEREINLLNKETDNVAFTYCADGKSQDITCSMKVINKDFSDGELHHIPVVSNMEEVTVTLPFSQVNRSKHEVNVEDIFPQATKEHKLSLDYTESPFWLAYKSLPSIMEENPQNAISIVATLYCNLLSSHIQKLVYPNVIDSSKYLFTKQLVKELAQLQKHDGGFAWYKSMFSSDFMTAEIMVHLSRLVSMTPIPELQEIMEKANSYLDKVICEEVTREKKLEQKGEKPFFPSYLCLQHMYCCALQDRHVTGKAGYALNHLLYLLQKDIHNQTIREKAMSAIVLKSYGERDKAEMYAESIYQYTIDGGEKGRWFDTSRASYSWMSYKIPTHVMAMEALYALRPDDQQTIDQMKIWLLQEKRTQQWETPIDSVNAIYALLLGEYKSLTNHTDNAITIYADGQVIETEQEALNPSVHADICASTKRIIFDKQSNGLSWGNVTAQFMQQLKDVSAQGSEITIRREILNDTSNLHVGDRIRIRLTCTCERNYDMVEIRDVRAACMEPVNQLSVHDSFVYVTPHDTETIYSYLGLSMGEHSIETEYYLTRPGTYQLGLATVQCCYAPEFRALCPSETIIVKD